MRTRRWIAVALAGAAAGLSLQVSAAAVSPGLFSGPSVVLPSLSGMNSSRSATLLDGSVGIAWTDGSSVHLTIRRPGRVGFPGTTLNYTPPVAFPTITEGAPISPAVTIVPLTASTFLLGWGEHGATGRAMTATVSDAASSFPAPVPVSGSVDVNPSAPPSFAGLPDGSAAAAWLVSSTFGYQVVVNRRAGLAGAWQALSSASVAGVTTAPIVVEVAVDSAQTVSAAWLSPGSEFQVMARSQTASHQWGMIVVAGTFHASLYAGVVPLFSLSSSGASTVLAAVDDLTGTSTYPADPLPTGINVISLPRGSNAWALVDTGLTGPGRHAVSPRVSTLPDGSAVVRFADYAQVALGTATDATEITTFAVQRRGPSGPWSGRILLDGEATAVVSSSYEYFDWSPTLLADGTYVTGVPVSLPGAPSPVDGAGLIVRPGWIGAPALVAVSGRLIPMFAVAASINATGRATLTYADGADGKYKAITSALTKPLPLAGPRLPATVRKAHAVGCAISWVEASSGTTYRWFRNGAAIAGVTAASYVPRAADVGRTLQCRVSVANPKGITTVFSAGRVVHA